MVKFSFSALVGLAFLELLLRIIDPLGFVYFDDMRAYAMHTYYDPVLEYRQQDGVIKGHGWKAQIAGGFRVVPDTKHSGGSYSGITLGCNPTNGGSIPSPPIKTIAIIGDSVAFGFGVNDDESFVNLLARKFPQVHFINGGIAGYNSKQILELHNRIKADRFLYLVNPNDANGCIPFDYWQKKMSEVPPFWIVRHYNYIRYRTQMAVWDRDNVKSHDYARDLSELRKADVTLAAFGNNDTIRLAVDCFKAYNIQDYMRVPGLRISYADGHPNAKGHEFIANQLEAIVRKIAQGR